MIDRYMPEDFEKIWSEENMFRTWLRVELEVCRVLAEKGWIPKESMEVIEKKADFSVASNQRDRKYNASRPDCLYNERCRVCRAGLAIYPLGLNLHRCRGHSPRFAAEAGQRKNTCCDRRSCRRSLESAHWNTARLS